MALLLVSTNALAQQTFPPARDTSAAAQKGTGVIRGTVVAGDTGRPLRRAQITVAGVGLGQDGRRTTSTGPDGTFVVKELLAARYRVTVTRGGYLQLEYGQRRPGEQGRPIQLAEGQVIEKVDFALPRMGAIAGRVTDENGEGIEGVSVFAMRSLFYDGKRKLVPVAGLSLRTDDEGNYRIPRLAPGNYQVMASTKDTWTVVQSGQETVFGYLPTYYPGIAVPTEARRVKVGLGEQVAAIDISLIPGRAAKVSGTALDSQGKPFTRVSLSEEIRGLDFASFGGGPSAPVAADGTFTIRNVPPGEYSLQASTESTSADTPPEAALQTVVVAGHDLEGLTLIGSSGGTVTGKIVSEDGPIPATGVAVTVAEMYRGQSPPLLLGAFRAGRDAGVPQVDGSFVAKNVFGRARFQVRVPEGWMLKSIRHEGRDITEDVIELGSRQQLSGVEVLITNKVTEINGQVLDEKNVPVVEATVLLFPADENRWYENSRAIRATRPDQQGRWQLKTMPAGEYLAVALDYMEVNAWQDPEFLAALKADATRITIREGTGNTVALKVVLPK